MRRALARHLGEHAAHHDVARRELGLGVDGEHEALAGRVAQQGAFAAQRFGHERRRRVADGQAGRMELHELEIAERGAGAIGHRHAVAGGDLGIGRAGVDLSRASGGEDGDHRQVQRVLAVGEVERQGADATPVDGQQIDGELVFVELHATADPGRFRQGARDLAAGRVAAGVQPPGDRVRALAAEHDLAVLAVEPRADLDQLADAVGALVDEHSDGVGVAKARAGVDRVLKMQVGGVGLAQSGGDAALGKEGRRVVQAGLGQQADVPAPRRGDRRRQAGYAAAEHERVELAAQQRPRRQARDVGTRHGGHSLAGRGRPPVQRGRRRRRGRRARTGWCDRTGARSGVSSVIVDQSSATYSVTGWLSASSAASRGASTCGMPRASVQSSASGTSTKARRHSRGCGSVSS